MLPKGLVGCPEKFNEADQSRVWDSLSSDDFSEFRAARVTIHTIYWIAGRYCGWNTGRRGRPMAQPRQIAEVSPQAKAVADAGRVTQVLAELMLYFATEANPDGLVLFQSRSLERIRVTLLP